MVPLLSMLSHPYAVESVWRHVTYGSVLAFTGVIAVMECLLNVFYNLPIAIDSIGRICPVSSVFWNYQCVPTVNSLHQTVDASPNIPNIRLTQLVMSRGNKHWLCRIRLLLLNFISEYGKNWHATYGVYIMYTIYMIYILLTCYM